jgi:hypothetical protein
VLEHNLFALAHQFLGLRSPDIVNGFTQLLGDMEPIQNVQGADNDSIFAETAAFGTFNGISGSIDGGTGTDTLIFTNQFTNNFAGATFQGIETT